MKIYIIIKSCYTVFIFIYSIKNQNLLKKNWSKCKTKILIANYYIDVTQSYYF